MQLVARRANIFPVLEVIAVVAFLTATLSTWLALSDKAAKGQLLPSAMTATLLVGTLVPAIAILMLIGRRMALRRAAESIGGRGRRWAARRPRS